MPGRNPSSFQTFFFSEGDEIQKYQQRQHLKPNEPTAQTLRCHLNFSLAQIGLHIEPSRTLMKAGNSSTTRCRATLVTWLNAQRSFYAPSPRKLLMIS
jgi:hypothetical protein